MSDESTVGRDTPEAPKGRIWLFRLLALLMGLAFIGLIEGALRLTGAVPLPAPIIPPAPSATHRALTSSGFPNYLVVQADGLVHTAPEAVSQAFLLDLTFTPEAAPGVLRIFCFGGSATMGIPNEDKPALSFPGRLEAILREFGIEAEVINLGGASFGSRQVVEVARETLNYDPDVLVVYSGNNEFFQYNLELHQANKDHLVFASRLDELHMVRLGRRLLAKAKGESELESLKALDPAVLRQRQDGVTASLLSRTLGASKANIPQATSSGGYRRVDPHARQVEETYRKNLRALGELSKNGGPQVVAVSVPSNLRHAPSLSLHDPASSALALSRFDGMLEDAKEASLEKDWEGAAESLEDALDIDPLYALAWHRLGMVRLQLGDGPGAKDALHNAMELDMNPGRPNRSLREAVFEVGETGGLIPIDGTEPFMSPDSKGAFGDGYFADSCHMTPSGYDRLALEVGVGLSTHWSVDPPAALKPPQP